MTTDKYPKFLPEWTKAVEHIQSEKTWFLKTKSYNWGQAIGKAKQEFGLNWASGACCLTGEAFFHEWAPTCQCDTCSYMTFDGSHSAVVSIDGLYKYKVDLAEHLEKEHPEIWEQWKEKMA